MTKEVKEIIDRMAFCPCDRVARAWDFVRQALTVLDSRPARAEPLGSALSNYRYDELRERAAAWRMRVGDAYDFVLRALDSYNLLEHGSNISNSWLDTDGELLLDFLQTHGCDPSKWPKCAE